MSISFQMSGFTLNTRETDKRQNWDNPYPTNRQTTAPLNTEKSEEGFF